MGKLGQKAFLLVSILPQINLNDNILKFILLFIQCSVGIVL